MLAFSYNHNYLWGLGNMFKIFLLIILVWLAYKMSRGLQAFLSKESEKKPVPDIQKMVKCAYCETYIPESESMPFHQHYICKKQPCKK
jgi:hypothetical protein